MRSYEWFLVSGVWWWAPLLGVWFVSRARSRYERTEFGWAIAGVRGQVEATAEAVGEAFVPVVKKAAKAFSDFRAAIPDDVWAELVESSKKGRATDA